MASAADVHAFLQRFVEVLDVRGMDLWPTSKNREFEDATGWTKADAESVARSLKAENYSRGPEPDDSPQRWPGEVWIFNREFEGYWLYIKLKLEDRGGVPAVCMSFHEQERPMATPHHRRRGG